MASRPRALTLSSMASSESLSYTASKTPMGILCMEEVSGDADLAALLAVFPTVFPVTKPAASPAEGTAAARRPLPVAARKCLRSMPALTRELFIFGGLRIKILTQWMGGATRNYTLWKPQAGNEIVHTQSPTTGCFRFVHHHVSALHYPLHVIEHHADVRKRVALHRHQITQAFGCKRP